MRREPCLLLALAAGFAARAPAQESEAPDLGFLEYLGSWQEGDEEWLVVAGIGGELEAETFRREEAREGETEGSESEERKQDAEPADEE